MTTPIQSQCPHCHVSFQPRQSQLNKPDTQTVCTHCNQKFLVNDHLIEESVATPSSHANSNDSALAKDSSSNTPKHKESPKSTVSQSERPQPSTDTLIHDDMEIDESDHRLIHDDMDVEPLPKDSLDYDSIDDMDAWLTQSSNDLHAGKSLNQQEPRQKTRTENSAVKDLDILSNHSEPSSKFSSAVENDIHASISNQTEHSWLEDLLKEQKKPNADEDVESSTTIADNNLSQLLTDMGVPIRDKYKTTSHSQINSGELSKRSKNRPSLATLFWMKGCIMLALLLFAQYVIFNMNTLIKNPTYAPYLQSICSITACTLPNADLSALSITSITHNTSRVNTSGEYSDIKGTLNNQDSQTQLLPNLKVSVYSANALIGEFIAAPEDYLLSTQRQLSGNGTKSFMFTVPITNKQINAITIDPMY